MRKVLGMNPAEPERFEACEHEDIADTIKLKFYGRGTNPHEENANEKILSFRKVKAHGHFTRETYPVPPLNFGQIMALAGDFYGIPDKPITLETDRELGNVTEERKQRARAAFNTIAEWKDEDFQKLKRELIHNLSSLKDERTYLEKGVKRNVQKYGIFSFHAIEELLYTYEESYSENATKQKVYFEATKANGRFKRLLETNYDHYQPYAKVAYEALHALALEEAVKARSKSTPNEKNEILQQAYALEAFGCNFLGDSFASGHMRTPRRELSEATKPIAKNGQFLVKKMRDEDNKYGLRVTSKRAKEKNPRNPYWIAYGNTMLHSLKNQKNFDYVKEAVQVAVDEVFQASQNEGIEIDIANSKVFDFIPYVDPTEGKNNTPMFHVCDGKLFRRKNLPDLTCKEVIELDCGNDWESIWKSLRQSVSTLSKLNHTSPTHSVIHSPIEESHDKK